MKASPRFPVALLALGAIVLVATAASATCTPGSTIPSVTICSPTATSGTPIHVTAAAKASTSVTYMAVWMDGVKKYQTNSNTVDTSISAAAGTHRITVQAKDAKGNTFASKVYTTVGTTVQTWAISGSISPAMSGVKVTLGGTKAASTTTGTTGSYAFSGLSNGTYSIAPSLSGYTFTPSSKNVSVNGANVSAVNFTSTTVSSGHSVSLSWNASTSSTVSGYKVYRATASGGPYALLNGAPVTSTIYSDLSVAAGATYYYVVTAVESSGIESTYSNQSSAKVPTP